MILILQIMEVLHGDTTNSLFPKKNDCKTHNMLFLFLVNIMTLLNEADNILDIIYICDD
jgi:hypothetical protein